MEKLKTFDYKVYLRDGDYEIVNDAWIGIQSARERTVFLDEAGEIKAVYMDSMVSHIVRNNVKA